MKISELGRVTGLSTPTIKYYLREGLLPDPVVLRYLNRLSDLLFVAGRTLNRRAGRTDVQWRHQRKKP